VIRLVLFDIDGTLIRAGGAGRHAIERAWREIYGISDCLAGVDLGGRTDASLFEDLYRVHGVEMKPSVHQLFIAAYFHLLHDCLHDSNGSCLEGSIDFLHYLVERHPDIVLGLLTGNSRLAAEIKLRHFGLWDPFVLGAFGDDHPCRDELATIAKSRGELFLERELAGEEILIVGDTLHDIQCARSIGAVCLAVATGGVSFDELKVANPNYLVQRLTDADADAIVGR
jgi:phosphoglycolate phosphatase